MANDMCDEEVKQELLKLLDVLHRVNCAKWYELKGEDIDSFSSLIGDTEEGCWDRTERILYKAGFIRWNSRVNTYSFFKKDFEKACCEHYPDASKTISAEAKGKEKNVWISIGEREAIGEESNQEGLKAINFFRSLALIQTTIKETTLAPHVAPTNTGRTSEDDAQGRVAPGAAAALTPTQTRTNVFFPEPNPNESEDLETQFKAKLCETLKESIKALEEGKNIEDVLGIFRPLGLGIISSSPNQQIDETSPTPAVVSPTSMTSPALILKMTPTSAFRIPAVVSPTSCEFSMTAAKPVSVASRSPASENKHFGTHTETVGSKYMMDVEVPNSYTLIRTQENNKYKALNEVAMKRNEKLSKTYRIFSEEEKVCIGAALAMTPKLSGPGGELFMFGTAKAIFIALDIAISNEQLQRFLPCKRTLEACLELIAEMSLFVGAARLEEDGGAGIYYGSDKADPKIKKGMVKALTKHCKSLATPKFPFGQIYTVILDSDDSGAKTEECADGTMNSLEKLPNYATTKIDGTATDSGGGFTIESKKRALVARGVCDPNALTANCSMHNMQLTGTVPMQKMYGSGSVGIRNLPQLLFLAWTIQTSMGRRLTREKLKECQELELDVEELVADNFLAGLDKEPDILQAKPDDGRWWYTGIAVDRLVRNREPWLRLIDAYLEQDLTQTEKDTGGNLKSLLKEPKVLCDLYMLAGFFRGYIFHHFKWLQGVDPNIGKPGFLSFHIVTRVFLMLKDLDRLANYRHEPVDEMNPFVQQLDKLDSDEEKQTKHEEAQIFFGWAKAELIKMFDRWIDERLFFLGAFGEHCVAKYIARWMLLTNEVQTLLRPGEAEHCTSEFHGAKIGIGELLIFFQEHCAAPEILRNDHHTEKNIDFIKQIADGVNIWDAESAAAKRIRTPTLRDYGGLPSSTQFLERGNKNHNYCSANGREERAIQARMIARSHLIEVTSITTVDGKRDASSGPQYISKIFGNVQSLHEAFKDTKSKMTPEKVEAWQEHIHRKLFDSAESYQEKLYQEKKIKINVVVPPERQPFAAELRRGYDQSPLQQKKVQYGLLGKSHVQAMHEELDARHIIWRSKLEASEQLQIRKLGKLLKENIRDQWLQENPAMKAEDWEADADRKLFFQPRIGAESFPVQHVGRRK
jgi:hypothetical protein